MNREQVLQIPSDSLCSVAKFPTCSQCRREKTDDRTGVVIAGPGRGGEYMELLQHDINIDFVGKRRFFLTLSCIINGLAIVLMLVVGLNYGLDFTGGTMVEVRFTQSQTSSEVRRALDHANLQDLTIQESGGAGEIFLVRLRANEVEGVGETGQAVQDALTATYGNTFEVLRIEAVGSRVSSDLRTKAVLAVAFATLLMGAYISMRFAPRFAAGAVIALIHDVFVVLGALVLTQTSFDLTS